MRIFKICVVGLLIVTALVFAGLTIHDSVTVDKTAPVLTIDGDLLSVSVDCKKSELLVGVSAMDDRDGDITGKVLIAGVSGLITADTARVSYIVFDSADNVATGSRLIRYTDYRMPHFALIEPLVFNLGDSVSIVGLLSAEDLIDGDLTDSIRVSAVTMAGDYAGTYTIMVQVTNSLGDTAKLDLPVVIRSTDIIPRFHLNTGLVYLSAGDTFDPLSVVDRVTWRYRPVDIADVDVTNEVNTEVPGVYYVTYSYTPNEGATGTAIVTVVVE